MSKDVSKLADWLKRGATMLSEACPICLSPLFRLRGEIWCPVCEKRVVIAKEGEDIAKLAMPLLLPEIEETILSKLQETISQIKEEKDVEGLLKLSQLLSNWVKILKLVKDYRAKKE